METLYQLPHRALRGHVRSFGHRRAMLTGQSVTTSLPARPDQFIEFYIRERYGISSEGGPVLSAPETAVVGPHSRPGLRLHISGVIDVFTIRFQPTGFHRLFGVPMFQIADQGIAIGDLVGRPAHKLVEEIHAAPTFRERIDAAERWLFHHLPGKPAETAFDHSARLLVATRGRITMDRIAERSGLGPRQFQRRFLNEVGLAPKLYARTLRLETALHARERHPWRSWTAIAHDAGYTDQSHFIRDCNALAGASPTRFLAANSGLTEISN